MVNVTCEQLREYRDYVASSKFTADADRIVKDDLPRLTAQLTAMGWETAKTTSTWLAEVLEKVRVELIAWAIQTERLSEERAQMFGGTENRFEKEPEKWEEGSSMVDDSVEQLLNVSGKVKDMIFQAIALGAPLAGGAVERLSHVFGLGCMYEEEGAEEEEQEGNGQRSTRNGPAKPWREEVGYSVLSANRAAATFFDTEPGIAEPLPRLLALRANQSGMEHFSGSESLPNGGGPNQTDPSAPAPIVSPAPPRRSLFCLLVPPAPSRRHPMDFA